MDNMGVTRCTFLRRFQKRRIDWAADSCTAPVHGYMNRFMYQWHRIHRSTKPDSAFHFPRSSTTTTACLLTVFHVTYMSIIVTLITLWHLPARLATFGFSWFLLVSLLHLFYFALAVSLDKVRVCQCVALRDDGICGTPHFVLCVCIYISIQLYLIFCSLPRCCHANHFAAKWQLTRHWPIYPACN